MASKRETQSEKFHKGQAVKIKVGRGKFQGKVKSVADDHYLMVEYRNEATSTVHLRRVNPAVAKAA